MANSLQLDCVPIIGVDNATYFSDNAVRKQKLGKNIIPCNCQDHKSDN